AAKYIAQSIAKPVIAYIAGRTAPRRQVMGHSSAVITTQITDLDADLGTFDRKIAAMKQAKIPVADRPSQIPDLLKKALGGKRSLEKA
ncbi:MAG: CoA-binding protein, partial [Microcoleus sp. SIO2G3]|nr:CoA-binding protein [Microcoleus sp. SIO2G3]